MKRLKLTDKLFKARVLLPTAAAAFLVTLTVYVLKGAAALEQVGLRGLYFAMSMALVFGLFLVGSILSDQNETHMVSYLCSVTVLVAIGLAYQFLFEDFYHHLMMVLISGGVGSVAFVIWRRMNGLNRPMYRLVLLMIFGLLAANLLLAPEINGARLWIVIGGLSFQPGELVKILLIVLGAASFRNGRRGALYCFASLCSCGVLLYLHDLGGAIVVFALFLLMTYLLFDSRLLSLSLMAAAVAGFICAVNILPYAAERMAAWGKAMTETGSWQQRSYITGVLLGGFDGLGLKDAHWFTDVFSASSDGAMAGVMAVYGVPLAMVAVCAYAVLAGQALLNHSVCTSAYFIHAQLGMYIFVQVVLNLCGSLDALPFTGIVAPLTSDGGSATICFSVLLGIGAAALAPRVTNTKEETSYEI